jgi:hypothetical protein
VQPVRHFLLSKTPSRSEATAGLKAAYTTAFGAQCLFIAVVGLATGLLVGRQAGSSPLVAQALLALSLLEVPVALLVAHVLSRPGGRYGALTAVLALAVILSTPAWLALFAWLVGSPSRTLLSLLLVLVFSYGVGFLRVMSYVDMALTEPDSPDNQQP